MADCIKSGVRKTRKNHACVGCRETMPIGTEMYYWDVVDNGTVNTIYSCKPCIDWCKDKNCQECHDLECAGEGFVAECKKESKVGQNNN